MTAYLLFLCVYWPHFGLLISILLNFAYGSEVRRLKLISIFHFFNLHTSIKSFSFFCQTLCIVGQKVSTKSWMAAISLSPLREYCYNLVLSCNIRVKGDKIKREYNPVRLPLETWYSLTVPQCATSSKGNWNSRSLYCACTFQGNAWDLEKIFLHQILQFLVWKRISWQLFF